MAETEVCLPSGDVGDGGDVATPTKALLRDLNLLPTEPDLQQSGGWGEAFGGPASSIALLEAGATAASKWWATGLGVSVVAAWGSVGKWWTASDGDVRSTAIWAAAIFSGAAVLGIAHLLGSDVRGRASVQTETIRARASVAEAFIRAAVQAHEAPTTLTTPTTPATPAARASAASLERDIAPAAAGGSRPQLVSLAAIPVRYLGRHDQDVDGWQALALLADGRTSTRYLLVKGCTHEWVEAGRVAFGFIPQQRRHSSAQDGQVAAAGG